MTLVDAADWPAGIAAASLVADPVGAPVLVTDGDEVGELTEDAIRALGPEGSAQTAGRQAFVVGSAATPDDLETLEVEGDERRRARRRARRTCASASRASPTTCCSRAPTSRPSRCRPPAGRRARATRCSTSQRESVPEPTREALERFEDVPVYVLGPKSAISAKAFKEIKKLAPSAERIGAEDPVSNAIEFARFASGSFGWNINDPGHGFVIANTSRPLDAAAAAPLSASGTWGPLLVTEDADAVPSALRGYLLDLKPGYEDDPTRALYNHLWLIGDTSALSVDFQAQLDEIAEVAPVTSGAGNSALAPPPGTTESQARRSRRPQRRQSGPRPAMSESERPDRLSGREITVEDVRALAGPGDAPLRAPDPQPDRAPDRLPARRQRRRGSRASARSRG